MGAGGALSGIADVSVDSVGSFAVADSSVAADVAGVAGSGGRQADSGYARHDAPLPGACDLRRAVVKTVAAEQCAAAPCDVPTKETPRQGVRRTGFPELRQCPAPAAFPDQL